MRYTALIDGRSFEVELKFDAGDSIKAEIDGTRYQLDVREVEPGVFSADWNGQSLELSITPNGEGYGVSISGQRLHVEILDARAALRRAAMHHGQSGAVELRAPMPGKVVRVLAPEGVAVAANQGVLVIEAMKMQNEVRSPKAGSVKKINVREGAAVNSGDLLAIVD
jgi:biotin carboxyl carrier protein